MEVERATLSDTVLSYCGINRLVGIAAKHEVQITKVAVDLVRRGKDEWRVRRNEPYRLQQVKGPDDIRFEVVARIDHARGDGDLCRHVEDRLRLTDSLLKAPTVAYIGDDPRDARAMTCLEPGEVRLHAGSHQGIIDDDVVTLSGQPVGDVAPDESGAPRDENWAIVKALDHTTSPRASSSARI